MINTRKLPCGVTLVTEHIKEFQSASIGIWQGAGSVCETEENSGISHFIEHMFFKGTASRSAQQIAKDSDDLGCSLNAFTGKEATCYHVKALTEVFPQAVDILLDMTCNSVFDRKEMAKEKGVIIEEMNMVEDTPDDRIMDMLAEKVFAGTPFASPVLGTRRSVRSIKREDISGYIEKHYRTESMVVAAVGNFDEEALAVRLEEELSSFGRNAPEKPAHEVSEVPSFACRKRDINQSHIALGIPTVGISSKDYYAQAVVNDILGGSMSSRLFQNIREKQGLAYTVFSAPMSYSNAGMLFIYAGLAPGKEKAALEAIAFELRRLAEEGISQEEVEAVKRRLKSGYIFSLESLNSRMYRLGRNMLLLGRTYEEADTMAEIDAVSAERVNAFASRLCDMRRYSGACISNRRIDLKRLMEGC